MNRFYSIFKCHDNDKLIKLFKKLKIIAKFENNLESDFIVTDFLIVTLF